MKPTFRIVITLILLGIGLFAYKAIYLAFPVTPDESQQSWHIEAKIEFSGDDKPVKAQMFLPQSTGDYAVVDENFISRGFGLTTKPVNSNRKVEWTKRNVDGKTILFYRAILYQAHASTQSEQDTPETTLPTYQDERFINKAKSDPTYIALSSIIEGLKSKSTDDSSFIAQLSELMKNQEDERIKRIREIRFDARTSVGLMSMILNYSGIPARIQNGLVLLPNYRNAPIIQWIEYFSNNEWNKLFLPEHTNISEQPVLTWWQGQEQLLHIEGAEKPSVSVSVKQHTEQPLTEAIWQGSQISKAIYDISLFSLPIDLQLVFQILLLIPIGSLINAFLRQMIGVQTFGTFMPVLIALSFRETHLLAGMTLFTVIVGLGVMFRGFLDRMQLLMVPRLAAVLTLVVIIIYILTLTTFKLGIHSGLSVSLFPMVVLTMVIERMSVIWEEVGKKPALIMCLGSFISASLCYLVMSNVYVTHLMMTFPELLLVILACLLMLGRYNGFKLFEYYRFKAMSK